MKQLEEIKIAAEILKEEIRDYFSANKTYNTKRLFYTMNDLLEQLDFIDQLDES